MKRFIRHRIQSALRKRGFEIRQTTEYGKDPFVDILKLDPGTERLVVFDVGANIGEVTRQVAKRFSGATIHAFEPDPETFKILQANTNKIPSVFLNNCGLGAINGDLAFKVNDHNDMSSFLTPDAQSWGRIVGEITVPVRTVDAYCNEKRIERIDVLKTDTQGYDLEVLRGAQRMIREHRIQMICMEVNFSQLYKGQPRFDEVYAYLYDRGFRLVTFYPIHYLDNRAGWTDALFTHVSDPQPPGPSLRSHPPST